MCRSQPCLCVSEFRHDIDSSLDIVVTIILDEVMIMRDKEVIMGNEVVKMRYELVMMIAFICVVRVYGKI